MIENQHARGSCVPLPLTTAAAGTTAAAAAAQHTTVIPDIFPFSQSVFEHQKLQKSLARSNFRKNGSSHHPTAHLAGATTDSTEPLSLSWAHA